MTEVERAECVMGLAAAVRDGLKASISTLTEDPDEQEQIAGAVVATLTRDMYRARGQRWLEKAIEMVLK